MVFSDLEEKVEKYKVRLHPLRLPSLPTYKMLMCKQKRVIESGGTVSEAEDDEDEEDEEDDEID